MRKLNVSAGYKTWDEKSVEEPSKPLTREQAIVVRQQNPSLSPWLVLAGQAAMGLLVALAAWLLTGKANIGWSAFYGALAVVVPGAVFARGVMSKVSLINPAAAVTGFFFVGNGEDRFGTGHVVCGSQTGSRFKLARHASGVGGDDEGGLVGALARG